MTTTAKRIGGELIIEQKHPSGSVWYRKHPAGWSFTADHKANALWHPIETVPGDVLAAANAVKAQ